jgi:hypothetical protein
VVRLWGTSRYYELLDGMRTQARPAPSLHAEYTDQVDLPLFKHEFVLRPRAEEPL